MFIGNNGMVNVANGGVGPMFGQVHHFTKYNKGISEYAENRYQKKQKTLWSDE